MKRTILIHILLTVLLAFSPFIKTQIQIVLSWGVFCTIEFLVVFLTCFRKRLSLDYLKKAAILLVIFTSIYGLSILAEIPISILAEFPISILNERILGTCLTLMFRYFAWGIGIIICIKILDKNEGRIQKRNLVFILITAFISAIIIGLLEAYVGYASFRAPFEPFSADNARWVSTFILNPYVSLLLRWVRKALPMTVFYILLLSIVKDMNKDDGSR